MTVFGITMVKDEEDVIGATIEHLLCHVDHIIVADNLSTDLTREILESFDSSVVTVLDDPEVKYLQSEKMTRLAAQAADLGADWVVPFDADEIWFSPYYATLKEHLESLDDDVVCVQGSWITHRVTTEDGEGHPYMRMRWRMRQPEEMIKVAARCVPDLVIEQGNHWIQCGGPFKLSPLDLEIRHFPYRSLEQVTRKFLNGKRAYEGTDFSRHIGYHWKYHGELIEEDEAQAEAIYNSLVISDLSGMVEDPAPLSVQIT